MNLNPIEDDRIAQTDEQTELDDQIKLKWRVYADSRNDFEKHGLRAAVEAGENVVSARAFERQKTAVVFYTVDELVDAFRRLGDFTGDDVVDEHDWMSPTKQKKIKTFRADVKIELVELGIDIDDFDVAPADDQGDDADGDAHQVDADAAADTDDAQGADDDEADSDAPDAADSDTETRTQRLRALSTSDLQSLADAADIPTDGDPSRGDLVERLDQAAVDPQDSIDDSILQDVREVLTPSQFRDYRATVLMGRSYDAQAEQTDTAPHTVRSNVSRGRKRLREAGLSVDGDDAL
jgi:DNA-directed RNA polymerase specialized sigma24 family protein